MEKIFPNHFGRCVRDLVVIGTLLGVVNRLTNVSDFGWLALNPSPWLLLPVLIGVRYGVVQGLIAGAAASAAIALLRANGVPMDARDVLIDQPFFFTALLMTGLIAGEAMRGLRRANSTLISEDVQRQTAIERMTAELEVTRETRQQLQEHLALLQSPLAGLDDDLRKVFTGPPEGLMERVLDLLHALSDVSSAAIYRRRGDRLHRIAAINPTGPLSTELDTERVPIARRALTERVLVSVKDALETTPTQPFLAAIPFEDAEGEGLLLVQDMPLRSLGWHQFARMEMVLLWVCGLQLSRKQMAGDTRLVPADTLRMLIGHALATHETHHLPSAVLKLTGSDLERSAKKIASLLPATATAAALPQHMGLLVLLPFHGLAEATLLAEAMRKQFAGTSTTSVLTSDASTLDAFWDQLLKP